MKVFVTGGGGFLGTAIIRKLILAGHEVTSYSRSSYPHLEKLGVTCIEGDLSDDKLLSISLAGHEACYHVASKVAMWGRYEDFYQTNTQATQKLLNHALRLSVKYFIYTSTPSVVFKNSDLNGVDESEPLCESSYSRYAQSKAQAEKSVLKANGHQLKTCSLRPHLIFGPGDRNLLPNVLEKAKSKRLKIIGSGKNQVDVLYVENAADAHLLALSKLIKEDSKVAGRAYFLGQGPIYLWDFINDFLALKGQAPITKKVPFQVAFVMGLIIEKLLSILNKYDINPPMTRFVALQLAKNHYFDHSAAQEDLGWHPKISIQDALKLTAQSIS